MANATKKVNKGTVRWADLDFRKRSSVTLTTALQFYTGAMVGLTTAGYLAKFDDTQSMLFVGTVRGDNGDPLIPVSTADDGTGNLDYQRPAAFELAIASVAVTDIGKKVYASFDQTGVLTSGSVYGNLIGIVEDVVGSGIALVQPAYDYTAAHKRLGAVRSMAATGAQTISKWDAGKTILVPNTAALTLTLPALATMQDGDELTFVKNHATDANIITLDGNASENIDAATTLTTLDAAFDTACLVAANQSGTPVWIVKYRDIA